MWYSGKNSSSWLNQMPCLVCWFTLHGISFSFVISLIRNSIQRSYLFITIVAFRFIGFMLTVYWFMQRENNRRILTETSQGTVIFPTRAWHPLFIKLLIKHIKWWCFNNKTFCCEQFSTLFFKIRSNLDALEDKLGSLTWEVSQ